MNCSQVFLIKEEIDNKTVVDVFPKKQFEWDLLVVKRKSKPLNIPAQAILNMWQ